MGCKAGLAGTAELAGDTATRGLVSPSGATVVWWLPVVPLLPLCRAQPLEGAEGHMWWQQAVPCEHRQAPAAAGCWPRGHPLRGL